MVTALAMCRTSNVWNHERAQTGRAAFRRNLPPNVPKSRFRGELFGRIYRFRPLEKPVRRAGEAKVFPQRLALVFPPEDAAALKLGNHAVDEIIQPLWQVREHDVEAV